MSQSHKDVLQKLYPIVPDKNMLADMHAEGNALDSLSANVDLIHSNGVPNNLNDETFVIDWEIALELKRLDADTIEIRRNRIVAKLLEKGSLQIAYFTSVAAALGYTIKIKELQPCMPGIFRVGDRLYDESGFWTYRVLVFDKSGPIEELELTLNRLKPADTRIEFAYELGV